MLDLAHTHDLLVGGAPDTFLGGGLQTCHNLLDAGALDAPSRACRTRRLACCTRWNEMSYPPLWALNNPVLPGNGNNPHHTDAGGVGPAG